MLRSARIGALAALVALASGCDGAVGELDAPERSETPAAVEPEDASWPEADAGAVLAPDAGAPPDGGGAAPDAGTVVADAGEPGMIFLPAGPVWIGCNSTLHCYPDEEPYRQVTLSAFWLDKHEVTRGEYRACVQAGVCGAPVNARDLDLTTKTDHPVRGVEWHQADAYCRWVGKRLPTIAQWERAIRGPGGRLYPWGADPPDCGRVNFAGCAGSTTPVGSYPAGATPEGALDMLGNVWEWLQDLYDEGFYIHAAPVDPVGTSGPGHVFRGGSWVSGEEQMDPWLGYFPDGTVYHDRRKDKIGFRCAR